MSIPELFIKRPIMTTLVMAAILIFGIFAYRFLPVSDLPNVDFPTIQVSAGLPGANADTMASAVATPLERQFTTIAGLDNMTSSSTLGSTAITLQFNLSRNINDVAPDIQAAISQATPLLPPGMPSPPTFRKVNPADAPILYLALTSTTLPLYELNEYADTLMAQRISMVPGVAQVGVFGSQQYAVRVQVNPDALASRGIGIDAVENAIREANVNLPLGTLNGPSRAFIIQASGQLTRAEAYREIIVAYRNGMPVRLKDIGRALDSVVDDKTAAWYGNKLLMERSIVLAIQRQPGANTVAVAGQIQGLMSYFQKLLPPSVKLHVVFDRSTTIRRSVNDVKLTVYIALALVILVIFLFLRSLSATVIPSLALPLCIVGTFAFMYLAGYTVDTLSLMAITLAIGFVVDDAIVMLENIVRHVERGERPMEAALKGSQEIGFTIVSMTISLAAVFIPILFMGGIIGRLFREFSVVIVVAILISGFISLSLTPMLCSRFLKPVHSHSRFYAASERVFDWMLRHYDRSLRWVFARRFAVLLVSFAVLIATGYLFVIIPKGFIPDEDNDQILAVTEAPQGTSFDQMVRFQKVLAGVVQKDPYVQQFNSSIGGGGASSLGGANFGRMFLRLKPRNERPLDVYGVIRELQRKFNPVPGMRVFMQNPPMIRIGGQLTKSQYQFALQSPNLDELYRFAPMLEARMRGMRELEGVTSDLQVQTPQVMLDLAREQASVLGVSAQDIENALTDAFGSRWISTIYAPNNQYRVLLELEPQFQQDPSVVPRLYISSGNSNRALVPISAVASFKENVGPQTINHLGQLPSVTISFNLRPGVSLGAAVEKVQAAARAVLPGTVTTSFQGTAQAFQSSIRGLGFLLLIAIAVIYLVLGILYESFIHPLTILSGLPSAGFGALLTLLIFKLDLNIYSFVGLILLIGIVKKNAIMQIDFALAAEREGKSAAEAIHQGCLIRFRPIMMTTFAALMSALHIALGIGSAARRPLGVAVVGGLLFSQLITLYLTPVVYTYLDALAQHRWHLPSWLRLWRPHPPKPA